MPLEVMIVMEPTLEPINFGYIRPGRRMGLPNSPEEGDETVVLRCTKEDNSGEVYIFPEARYDLIGPSVSETGLEEEMLETYIWPDEIFRRRVVNLQGSAGMLIVQHVKARSIPTT